MELPAIKNYFYFRGTLSKFSKTGFGEFTEVHLNILFSIHCIETEGTRCTKTALYQFMSVNYHTPHKTKLFALIGSLWEKGLIRKTAGTGIKFLTLTQDGKLLLSSINERLLLANVKR